MKVLLAYRCSDALAEDPEVVALPAGLPWLAATLRKAGHQAEVANFSRLGWKDVERYLRERVPDVAGISTFTANRASAIRLARLVRRTCPGAAVALGGPHASALHDLLLRRVREVDFVVVGEGETAFAEACAALARGGLPAVAAVAGVSVRGVAPGPARLADLDGLPRPAPSIEGAGILPPRDLRHVVAARERHGHAERRSPASIVDELRELRDELGVLDVSLVGPGLLHDPRWLRDLGHALVVGRVAPSWEMEGALEGLTRRAEEEQVIPALRAAHAAGCRRIRVTLDVDSEPGPGLLESLTEASRVLKLSGPAGHLTLRSGRTGEPVPVSALRTLTRAFRPREARLEPRLVLPGSDAWRELAARDALEEGYWFEEDRPLVTAVGEEEVERATAALDPVFREVTRGGAPSSRDLSALESAVGGEAWVHVEWGDYRAALGDAEEAERRYRLAATAQPWNPWPWMRMAQLFARGRADGAREAAALRQVLERTPRHEPSRARLEELRAAPDVRTRARARGSRSRRRG